MNSIDIAILGAAFVSGSIPFGWIVARRHGIDLFAAGSGNIGATNVARVLGKRWGVFVMVLDALKGTFPTIAATAWGQATWLPMAAGLAAILGHLFPPWLRFRGGKGVATSLGVFVALAPFASGIACGVWLVVYGSSRLSSLASLLAASSLVATLVWRDAPFLHVLLGVIGWCLIVVRHRGNIQRLVKRQETKV